MAKRGEAYLNFTKALSDTDKGIKDDMFSIGNTQRKMNRNSGRGRGLGGLLGAILGSIALPGIGTAIGAGLGSRAGSEIGEHSVRGKKKLSQDTLFRRDDVKRANQDYSNYYRDFNSNQNMSALSDAFTAYLGSGGVNTALNAGKFAAKGGSLKDLMAYAKSNKIGVGSALSDSGYKQFKPLDLMSLLGGE